MTAALRARCLLRAFETVDLLTQPLPSDNVRPEHDRKKILTDLNQPIRAKEKMEQTNLLKRPANALVACAKARQSMPRMALA